MIRRPSYSILGMLALAGCALPPPYSPPSRPAPTTSPAPQQGQATPDRPTAPPLTPEQPPPTYSPGSSRPEPPPSVGAPAFRLSPATQALVAQARTQATSGDYAVAAGTVERALRIEPDNPLLWIELGRIRLAEGNVAQAESVGRKAVSLARGDSRAEASAWELLARALEQGGRTAEAVEAEAKATALRTR